MKETVNYKDLVGKTVVYYEPYARDLLATAKVGSITKVGPKYITVGRYRFDKDTLGCQDMNYRLFIGTHAELSQAITSMKNISRLLDAIRQETCLDIPLEQMMQIEQDLTDIKKRLEDGKE